MARNRRYVTGFRGEPRDQPGIIEDNDGTVSIVLPDGGRKVLDASLDTNPMTLSFPVVGAAEDTDLYELLTVAPYLGYIERVGYVVKDDFLPGSGQERTWTLEDADGNALFSVTLNDETGGIEAGQVLVFELGDPDVIYPPIVKEQPLFWRSAGTNAPADPGGLVLVAFVDPPPFTLPVVSIDGNTGKVGPLPDYIPPDPGPVVDNVPNISTFTPQHGPAGQTVTISGQYFQSTGANACQVVSVQIAGNEASHFNVNSDTRITAIADAGGKGLPQSGRIRVVTQKADGTQLEGISSASFTIDKTGTPPPPGGGSIIPAIAIAFEAPEAAAAAVVLGGVAVTASALLADGSVKYPDSVFVTEVGTHFGRKGVIYREQGFAKPASGRVALPGGFTIPAPNTQIPKLEWGRWVRVTATWSKYGLTAVGVKYLVKSLARTKEKYQRGADMFDLVLQEPGGVGGGSAGIVPAVNAGVWLVTVKGLTNPPIIHQATLHIEVLDGRGHLVVDNQYDWAKVQEDFFGVFAQHIAGYSFVHDTGLEWILRAWVSFTYTTRAITTPTRLRIPAEGFAEKTADPGRTDGYLRKGPNYIFTTPKGSSPPSSGNQFPTELG